MRGYFNPRSPHGERPEYVDEDGNIRKFQSTLPARGATLVVVRGQGSFGFQSTLPARGATLQKISTGKMELISIHAPRTGSDATRIPVDTHSIISIHAPRTGSDDYSTSHKSGHPFTAGV